MNRFKTPTLLTIFAALLICASGCARHTRRVSDQKPPVRLPETFSVSGSEVLPEKWWTALKDPALETVIHESLKGNFSLKAAWNRMEQSIALARKAGAMRWPEVNATASMSHTRRETAVNSLFGDSNDTEVSASEEFSMGLSTSYELDIWRRVSASRDASVLQARASREDLHAAALSLTAQTARVWYGYAEQAQLIKLLDEQIRTNSEYLELIRLRFRKGQASAVDVLQLEKLLEGTKARKISATAVSKLYKTTLGLLTGRAEVLSDDLNSPQIPDLPSLPKTGVPAEWITRRPDIRSARLRVSSAHGSLDAAIAARFPQLKITAGISTAEVHPANIFRQWIASLASNLLMPIFDAGKRRAEAERARAAALEKLNQYGQAILTGIKEVEDALSSETQQKKTIASVEKQLELSRRTLERILDKYTNGAASYLRVLDELRTYQSLEQQLVSARVKRLLFRIDLYAALGGAWTLKRPVMPELPREPETSYGRDKTESQSEIQQTQDRRPEKNDRRNPR